MLDKKQLSDIGFSYVLERLEPCSALGEELKRRAAPYSADDGGALLRELENVGHIILLACEMSTIVW